MADRKTVCGVVTSGVCHGANCVLWGACPMGKALEETRKDEAGEGRQGKV